MSWFKSKILAVSWLLIMNILFMLPGSTLPKSDWFTDVQLDKWVHVVLFAVLVFLWCSAFDLRTGKKRWMMVTATMGYAVLVEIVQKLWVPNRSFDMYDVLEDAAGRLIGLFVWLRMNTKVKSI